MGSPQPSWIIQKKESKILLGQQIWPRISVIWKSVSAFGRAWGKGRWIPMLYSSGRALSINQCHASAGPNIKITYISLCSYIKTRAPSAARAGIKNSERVLEISVSKVSFFLSRLTLRLKCRVLLPTHMSMRASVTFHTNVIGLFWAGSHPCLPIFTARSTFWLPKLW